MRTALVAGSTGLIGKQLLSLLLADDRYTLIKAISRSPLAINHPKLQNVIMDFDRLSEKYQEVKADDVFCCLGTTIRKAGSERAFRKVDYDYPVELAKLTHGQGAKNYLIITALGADKNSRIFYNKVKGETEEAVKSVGFKSLHIFRPSLLLGPREESRAGEDAAKIFYKLFGWIIPQKYKAIDAIKVARAMIACATRNEAGTFVHESKELQLF